MKVRALTMLVAAILTRVRTGMAAPLADLAAVSRPLAQTAKVLELRDGVRYTLGGKVGLFVDYKDMRPSCGALSPLDPGLPAKPPVRLGSFVVSAGIRFYFN